MRRHLKILVLTSADVVDCNYMSATPSTRYFTAIKRPGAGTFLRELLRLTRNIGGYVVGGIRLSRSHPPRRQLAFMVTSRNNYSSVSEVQRRIPGSYFLSVTGRALPGYTLPGLIVAVTTILSLPLVTIGLLTSSGHARKSRTASFAEYALTYGYYYSALALLWKAQPSGIVFTSDHSAKQRAVRLAASRLGMLTFFIPHGVQDPTCIPPLDFDYAYLDGRVAVEKYAAAGGAARVYEVGVPKFDAYADHINRAKRVTRVGICTNPLTPAEGLDEVLQRLSRVKGIRVVVRPHPGDDRPLFKEMADDKEIAISDPLKEQSFAFLSSVDAIIAGDSGILLEAALMDVYPLYFGPLGLSGDVLGFVQNGVAEDVSDPRKFRDTMDRLIDSKVSIRQRARRYVSTVGTAHDGRSAELVTDLISAHLAERSG